MGLTAQFYKTTVGKKIIMAASGLVLVGFVVGHMAGNLKLFMGIDPKSGNYKIDDYGHHLRAMGQELLGEAGFLWIVRVVLLVCVLLHASSGIQLARLNRLAKPKTAYGVKHQSANAASLTMMYGGLFLILFIVYHILHFTTGQAHTAGFKEGMIYSNVWLAFQSPWVAGVYVFAMACLGLHLYHGTWSMFQTLGVDTPRWNSSLRTIAKVLSVVLFLGFASVPLSIGVGLLPAPVLP